jgi:alpha-L-arabinofuranosidase
MFALNRGDVVLPTAIKDANAAVAPALPRLYATASGYDGGDMTIKVVNSAAEAIEATIRLEGMAAAPKAGEATVLAGMPNDENSIAEPEKVRPVVQAIEGVGAVHATFPALFTVLRIKSSSK